MEVIKSFILGLVQGLTEFLPVSSSGHIEIFKEIMNFSFESHNGLFFTLILHLATALSALIYFWNDVKKIIHSICMLKKDENLHFSLMILISMIPAGFVGFFYEDKINELFNGNLLLVGSMLILTSILLFISDKINKLNKKLSPLNSLLIGISQALAILPGISRSGSTIATSIFLGINRDLAAKFSFLMVIPVIVGSSIKMILFDDIVFDNTILINYIIGFITALVSGYYACKWMIFFVKKSKLVYFSLYCLIVGLVSIIYSIL
ncbi:MAG: undecaprenyl-diphosphate phosphatase [Cryomorphaceae bacterium]|nr:MAG: undecaprenyl-diphosphate phosphatase [Cryomorphaceae bacterium]